MNMLVCLRTIAEGWGPREAVDSGVKLVLKLPPWVCLDKTKESTGRRWAWGRWTLSGESSSGREPRGPPRTASFISVCLRWPQTLSFRITQSLSLEFSLGFFIIHSCSLSLKSNHLHPYILRSLSLIIYILRPFLVIPLKVNVLSHPYSHLFSIIPHSFFFFLLALITVCNHLSYRFLFSDLPHCSSRSEMCLTLAPVPPYFRNHACLISHCKLQDLIANKVWHIIDSIRTCWMRVNMQKNMRDIPAFPSPTYVDTHSSSFHPVPVPLNGTAEQKPLTHLLSAPVTVLSRGFLPLRHTQSLPQSNYIFWEKGWTKHTWATWTEWTSGS